MGWKVQVSDPYRTLAQVDPLPAFKPLTDDEFREALQGFMARQPGPLYVNPMFVARLRKVFWSEYDPKLTFTLASPKSPVGKLYGVWLHQTRDIPDGWVYAPPGGHMGVLRCEPADQRYLHQLDLTADPYVAPKPIPTRYDILMDR